MKNLIMVFVSLLFSGQLFAANPKVEIKTNMGNMIVELAPKDSPNSVKNFLSYVEDKYYDKTIFHRVINKFMIQGGGFDLTKDGSHKKKSTKPAINNESKITKNGTTTFNQLKNKRGTIAMARTNYEHSATSQFFINHKNNTSLDVTSSSWGYTVFGQISATDKASLAILDKIAITPTKGNDVPIKNVIINSIRVIK